MKYLSVCSGIEAASVAWEPLGWEAVGFSEIEPFPRAVLAHHYPHVPLHGDFTALIEDPPSCDVLVGGTPCQAFSAAGSRRSLDDARGNLTLAYVMLADAIDRRNLEEGKEPCITVWENVPGVFSTKDNAFGAFLGGLSGEDGPLEPPGGKWTHCGAVLGPTRAVCWRVQDAQYHGLAQRRRRVFVVASARDGFDPTQVLLEWEGVRRDTPPSRPTRENPAAASGVSPAPRGGEHAGRGDGRVETPCPDPAGPIGGAGQSGGFRTTDLDNNGSYIVGSFPWPQEVADPLTSNEAKTYTHEGTTFRTRGVRRRTTIDTIATSMVVRRLTPRECERLQGFPDDYTIVPWRGKPCPDGPRYKALGNSMAVPVMRWIGRRIDAHTSPHLTSPHLEKPMTDIHEYLTADRECLLALLSALLSAETIPSPTAQVLEQYLGLGWARDYASARSPQEREELIVRRLRLHQPIRRARPGSVAPCTEVVR